jgi:hypothetical protein
MKKDDACREIVEAWHRWRAANLSAEKEADARDGLLFFSYLQSEKPYLLSFASRSDKWQVIHGWLLSNNLVVD